MIIKVWLLIMTLNTTGNPWFERYYEFPTMEDCQKSLAASKTDLAKGGDAEAAVVMACVVNKSSVR